MSAKQAQHAAAAALFGAIIEALEKNRKEGTLTSTALDELARAYAAVATNVPDLGHLE